MKAYKMREFDMIFKGDAAFVCFIADVEANTPGVRRIECFALRLLYKGRRQVDSDRERYRPSS